MSAQIIPLTTRKTIESCESAADILRSAYALPADDLDLTIICGLAERSLTNSDFTPLRDYLAPCGPDNRLCG